MNPDPDDVTFQFNQIQLTDEDADVSFGFNQANDDGSKSVELTPENDDVANDDEIGSVSQQLTPTENDDVDDDVTFNISQVQIDSKSQQFTPENDDVANEDDDVTFGFSQVQINTMSKSQQLTSEELPENSPEKDDVANDGDDVTFGFNQVEISAKNDSESQQFTPENADVDDEGADVDEEDDDVEGEEFTFMCLNSDNTVTELTEKTVFPLFDQSLLHNNINEDGKRINVPVNNVFIESPRDSRADTSSSSSSTTLTAITDSNEMNIKSNSTGFSKLWRFRDNNNINRSNSDGRDAFVFLNNPKTEGGNGKGFLNNAKTEGNGKGKAKEVVKKKVKKANVGSAHEVYLKQKGGGEEEFKRKSYLPYRPGLMGFFTNVNGGLSKNVHPF